MPDYPLEFFVDFIIPGLIGLVGLFFIWRGLKAYRRKPARRCLKCHYDMRESQNLSCPECGHVAKNQKEIEHGKVRPLFITLGVFLLLPIIAIGGFFAWYIPQTNKLPKQIQALQADVAKLHWPQVSITMMDWYRSGNYWITPWADMFIDRETLRAYDLKNHPSGASWASKYSRTYDWDFARTYLINLVCTPGRHYGRYIYLLVPGQLGISDHGDKPTDLIQVTHDQLAKRIEGLEHFIATVYIDINKTHDSETLIIDSLTGIQYATVGSNDIRTVEQISRKAGLRQLTIYYFGPPQDAERIAKGIASEGRQLSDLEVTLLEPHLISPDTFQRLVTLPKLKNTSIPYFQVDAQLQPEKLLGSGDHALDRIKLNLLNCSDAQLTSLKNTVKTFLELNLNNAPVTDEGLKWLTNSPLESVRLLNAPKVKFETIVGPAFSPTALDFKNVGLTDAGLQSLQTANLQLLVIDNCPVSDAAIIEFMKHTRSLHSLVLGERKLSRELIDQLAAYAWGMNLRVKIENIDDQTLDLFLVAPQTRLTLYIVVDWDTEKTNQYRKRFSDVGMYLDIRSAKEYNQ